MKRTPMPRGTAELKRSGPLKASKPMRRGDSPLARAAKPMRADGKQKAPLKSRKIPATAAEQVWMAAVAQLGCIVCRQQGRGFVPCAVHHIVDGGRRVGHMFTIGLCDPGHHQNSPDPAQISRHPNKARFTAAYGNEYELLRTTQDIINGRIR